MVGRAGGRAAVVAELAAGLVHEAPEGLPVSQPQVTADAAVPRTATTTVTTASRRIGGTVEAQAPGRAARPGRYRSIRAGRPKGEGHEAW